MYVGQSVLLALLISHSAGSLASGLAGSLALTAAALDSTLLEIRLVERLDVLFHEVTLPSYR